MTSILSLIDRGVLRFAAEPLAQPTLEELTRAGGYTIPLIKDDYPAKTALLWNATYRALRLPYRNAMMLADPHATQEILLAFRTDPKYLGGGAGVGFKDVVPPYLYLDDVAGAIQAVNVISRAPDGKLRGHNTDGDGFVRGLGPLLRARGASSVTGLSVVVLGAGGAGPAIASAFARANARRVAIVNRTIAKAERVVANIRAFLEKGLAPRPRVVAYSEDALLDALSRADIVVNTTTKGQGELREYSAFGPVPAPGEPEKLSANRAAATEAFARLSQSAIVCDIVIAKQPTPFLVEAAARGHATQDGVPMVVEQAINAFLLIHPDAAPRERIAELMWATVR